MEKPENKVCLGAAEITRRAERSRPSSLARRSTSNLRVLTRVAKME